MDVNKLDNELINRITKFDPQFDPRIIDGYVYVHPTLCENKLLLNAIKTIVLTDMKYNLDNTLTSQVNDNFELIQISAIIIDFKKLVIHNTIEIRRFFDLSNYNSTNNFKDTVLVTNYFLEELNYTKYINSNVSINIGIILLINDIIKILNIKYGY